ncbi:MAG TPA: GAF domain-containing sensor histidine kinase [bacterium]|nr:GAF domain-containing sensor histidine kinase [bacterium]
MTPPTGSSISKASAPVGSPKFLDFRFQDFTARHVFTAKLRLVIIIGFWGLVSGFYPWILTLDQPIMLIISLTFVMTTVCYFFILRGVAPVFFFILELVADVAAQTVLVYLTGGEKSNFYTIYIIYCAAGGLFYNYRVSVVISVIILSFYSSLLAATHLGWIGEFSYPLTQPGLFSGLGPLQNLALLVVFLVVAIYGIWLASYFTQIRERALEAKNRELMALSRISALTRSGITLERVRTEVVKGVHDGMGYPAGFLLYQDIAAERIRVFLLEKSPIVEELKKILHFNPSDIYLPIDDETNQVYQAMRKKKLIIRNEFAEVLKGAVPEIPREQAEALQTRFGFHKFVAAPLVAEGQVLGALIGVSRDKWIEPDAIRAFEGFADQAALMLDNAMLIAELKRKNIELERVSRVKSEFLATMSHELRTPLTAIIGFSELLLEDVMGTSNPEQKESLREVLVNGENLLQMINGLLDLAKIESGKMELTLGPVDMVDLLERVHRMIASLLQKKNQHYETRVLTQPFPVVYADEKKLQQVLLNLLSNAVKFTPNGGSIAVSVEYLADGEREGTMHVEVSDTGIGIQPRDAQTIFESFKQVDSSFTREYQGTGLGLALVKQFVDLHHGKIRVESEVGRGSRFIFSIPNKNIA